MSGFCEKHGPFEGVRCSYCGGPQAEAGRATPPKAMAWLVGPGGRSFQLNCGETSLGRAARNDIQLSDLTLSKDHAKILEAEGRFRLYDLGSVNGVKVNGRRIYEPVLLEADDRIELGDGVFFQFVTGRR